MWVWGGGGNIARALVYAPVLNGMHWEGVGLLPYVSHVVNKPPKNIANQMSGQITGMNEGGVFPNGKPNKLNKPNNELAMMQKRNM